MRKKLYLFFSSFFLLFLFTTLPTFAQNVPLNITLSPTYFDLTANPGDTISNIIRVRANGTSAIPLHIVVKKLGADQNGNLTIQDITDDSANWITFPKTQITAIAQDWTEVPFTIKIPKTAGFGYYYAISFVAGSNQTANAKVAGAGAVPVLLTVNRPGAAVNGQLVRFSTDHYINEYLPINFTSVIKSTGNIELKPHGDIFIRGIGESEIGTIDVNLSQGIIIPGTNRTFNSSWDDGFVVREPVIEDGRPLTDARGNTITHLVFHWDKLTSIRIGKYTANLIMVYDNGQKDVLIEGTTTFWVLPYKIIGGAIILIVALILLIRFLLKWYVKKEIKKTSRRRH